MDQTVESITSSTSQRPLTKRQRSELQGYLSPWVTIGRAILFLAVAAGLAALLRSVIEYLRPDAHFLWWVVPPAAFMVLVFVRAKRWTGGPELRERIRADLQGGVLRLQRIDVAEAIEVTEAEDEGPAYFIKTTEGRVLVFCGQHLDGLKHRGFPWKSFEITEAPASQLYFHLKRLDGTIKPSFLRQPFTSAEFKQYARGNYRALDVDFETLKTNPVPVRIDST
jgi:hypothetical protein